MWILIPGLAMNAVEFSKTPNARALQNPGFGSQCAQVLSASPAPKNYKIEDIAKQHVESIKSAAKGKDEITIVGFSMGGFVLSVLASKYRSELPPKTRFVFMATSPNLPSNPVLKPEMVASWSKLKGGDVAGFDEALAPFFSEDFRRDSSDEYLKYIKYRAFGKNGQSGEDFGKQVSAILRWNGEEYFKNIDPSEAVFIFGGRDSIIDQTHVDDVRRLVPGANIQVIPDIGHMIHLENPEAFENAIRGGP